jgi:AraC-like DNA-binding protein
MSASTIAVFSDPRAFEAALQRGCNVELLVTGAGRFQTEFISIVLPRLRLLRAKEQLARIAIVSVAPGSMLVILPPRQEQLQTCGGARLAADEIMTVTGGKRLHTWTPGACDWGIVSISARELVSHGQAMLGRNFNLASGISRLRPNRDSLRSLTTLFGAVIRLTETRPSTPVKTDEAIRGLEQEVIDILLRCVSTATVQADVASHWDRATMARLDQWLQDYHGRVPLVQDICTALGISERTLRACCRQQVGVGPSRYFQLRLMRRVYGALWDAKPESASVQQVAKRHGFNAFGRFASTYRRQFGELPSTTLHRDARG